MKGSPAAPQCGFSQRVVAILRTHGAWSPPPPPPARLRSLAAGCRRAPRRAAPHLPAPPWPAPARRALPAGVDIHGVDILSDAALRTFMKEFSEWPTFPQLYINGACERARSPAAAAAAAARRRALSTPSPSHARRRVCRRLRHCDAIKSERRAGQAAGGGRAQGRGVRLGPPVLNSDMSAALVDARLLFSCLPPILGGACCHCVLSVACDACRRLRGGGPTPARHRGHAGLATAGSASPDSAGGAALAYCCVESRAQSGRAVERVPRREVARSRRARRCAAGGSHASEGSERADHLSRFSARCEVV